MAFCAFTAALLLSIGSAQAATIHTFSSSFGSKGAGDGQFNFNLEGFPVTGGAAIDQTDGDLYVADTGNARIEKFDSTGKFLSAWGWGVTDGKAESEVCTSGCQAGIVGSGPGQFISPISIAVDNSGGPSDGDIYIGDVSMPAVEKFTSDGKYLSTNNGSASGEVFSGEGYLDGVAVDANGDLFVMAQRTFRYSQDGTYLGLNPSSNFHRHASLGFALDSPDAVYADMEYADYELGVIKFNFFEHLSPHVYDVFPPSPSYVSLAVDPTTSTLYAFREGVIQTYAPLTHPPNSPPLEEFGQGYLSGVGGIAVRGSNGAAYAVDPSTDSVQVFSAVTIPDANTTSDSDLGTTSATLNGTVDPLGIDAHYQFEWGETAAYGNAVPASPADAGSGEEPIQVSEGISGLQPGTTYHYRLVATNKNGTTHGEDRTFTTLLPVTISEVFASSVGSIGATVNATINPGGGTATYHVEYGTSEAYGQSAPASEVFAGFGSSDHPVTQTLQGLEPDTTYHYRFVAQNAGGQVEGEDRTFHTFGLPQTGLPEGRAYEMVSPPNKNGGDIATRPDLGQVAADGNAISYTSASAFADSQGTNGNGNEYVAQRNADGWVTRGVTPLQIPQEFPFESSGFIDLSPNLDTGIFLAALALEPGHPNVQDSWNLYGASNLLTPRAGSFQLLTDSVNPASPAELGFSRRLSFAATSSDFSHVLFEDKDNLTEEADGTSAAVPKLYESVHGNVHLEGLVPPPGETTCDSFGPACEIAASSIAGAGAGDGTVGGSDAASYTTHTMSADGSRIFFEAAPLSFPGADATGFGNFGTLYMRENEETTTQLNVSERSTLDPSGVQPAKFLDATPDGSKIFFVTKQELTDEDTNENYDIYMYDVEKPEGERLTLISRDENALDGEGDAGFVVGTSTDGSYVYFTGRNQLVPGQQSFEELGLSPGSNPDFMYVWHEGEVRFVGAHERHSGGLSQHWGYDDSVVTHKSAQVTPDGKHIVFPSNSTGLAHLAAGYDNTNGTSCVVGDNNRPPCEEVYTYSYEDDHLTCASCDPSGQAPVGDAPLFATADYIPSRLVSQHLEKHIMDDGSRIFFSSPDALVAGDTNNRYDAYEYNTETGKVSLISTGQCACDSYFLDLSPDGHDAFFTTRQRLVAIDTDNNSDIYDARIGGGIAAQNRVPVPGCEGDACQPAPNPPNDPTPSSSNFEGAGNLREESKAKKHKRHPHGHRRHKRSHKRAANHKRGGAK